MDLNTLPHISQEVSFEINDFNSRTNKIRHIIGVLKSIIVENSIEDRPGFLEEFGQLRTEVENMMNIDFTDIPEYYLPDMEMVLNQMQDEIRKFLSEISNLESGLVEGEGILKVPSAVKRVGLTPHKGSITNTLDVVRQNMQGVDEDKEVVINFLRKVFLIDLVDQYIQEVQEALKLTRGDDLNED